MTYPVLTPGIEAPSTAIIEVPQVLGAPAAARFNVKHGLDSTDVSVKAFTADGTPRGVAYLTVLDADTIQVTVSDEVAYIEVTA